MSDKLLEEGVFVTGFGFPVVPEGTARIRVQISAALTKTRWIARWRPLKRWEKRPDCWSADPNRSHACRR